MRFSLAALIPLAVLVAPVLSGAVSAREPERKGEHKGEHKVEHVKGHHHKERDVDIDFGGNGSAWKPTWTWPGSGKQCPSDVHKDCPCLKDVCYLQFCSVAILTGFLTVRVRIQMPSTVARYQLHLGASV